jgi:hypothetical protein
LKDASDVLPLRLSDEIMNPKITIAFQSKPHLFRHPLEKKNMMKRGLADYEIECFLR